MARADSPTATAGAPPGSRCGTAPARYAPAELAPSVMQPTLAAHSSASIAASALSSE